MRSRALAPVLFAAVLGCQESDGERAPKVLAGSDTPSIEIVGVHPEDFECDSVAPPDELRAAVGYPLERTEPSFQPPAGVPEPCGYAGKTEERPSWSFDIDCREGALEDGASLMVRYADAPEAAPVAVGKSGLDHAGASLLFLDEDAPCYVRVLGPDAEGRLALARVVARRLTERTAPTGESYREVD